MNITYLTGDATDPFAAPGKPKPMVLVHIVNDASTNITPWYPSVHP